MIDKLVDAKAKKLKQLYLMATKASNKEDYEVAFFNEFPDTFKQLNNLYGYENDKPGPLYNEAIAHINELFNNLKTVNDTLYYKKIISIAKDARWDADAVSYFQNGLQESVNDKLKLTLYILKDKSEKEVIDFWAFYFDYENSSMRNESYNKLLKSIGVTDSIMKPLITAGYQQSAKYWKDSH